MSSLSEVHLHPTIINTFGVLRMNFSLTLAIALSSLMFILSNAEILCDSLISKYKIPVNENFESKYCCCSS